MDADYVSYGFIFFFFDSVRSFNKNYTYLFGTGDDEDGTEDLIEQKNDEHFTERWGWILALDTVSGLRKSKWEDLYKMNVKEFLNMLAYIKSKTVYENEIKSNQLKSR